MILSAAFFFVLQALAASSDAPASAPVMKTPNQIDWKVTGSLPAQAGSHEYHLIYENKATSAFQTLVRFDKGFALPAHRHSHDETVVIMKGRLLVAMDGLERTLGPGSYAVIPGGTPHAFKAKGRCEFVFAMAGPYDFLADAAKK